MVKKDKKSEFYENDKGKYETKTRFDVFYIDYDKNNVIKDLIIKDDKKHIRFQLISRELEERTTNLQKNCILYWKH